MLNTLHNIMQQPILKFAKRAMTFFTTTNKSCSFQQAVKSGQTYYIVCGVEHPTQYNDIHSLDKICKNCEKMAFSGSKNQ